MTYRFEMNENAAKTLILVTFFTMMAATMFAITSDNPEPTPHVEPAPITLDEDVLSGVVTAYRDEQREVDVVMVRNVDWEAQEICHTIVVDDVASTDCEPFVVGE